jgi:hypothetical protein
MLIVFGEPSSCQAFRSHFDPRFSLSELPPFSLLIRSKPSVSSRPAHVQARQGLEDAALHAPVVSMLVSPVEVEAQCHRFAHSALQLRSVACPFPCAEECFSLLVLQRAVRPRSRVPSPAVEFIHTTGSLGVLWPTIHSKHCRTSVGSRRFSPGTSK